jgi:tetratricopeptide (TPR) repeat protein
LIIAAAMKNRLARKGRYLTVSLLLLIAIAVSGWMLNTWMTEPVEFPVLTGSYKNSENPALKQVYTAAVRHMQLAEHEQALRLWHQLLLTNPELPEIKVNMGFSLYELEQFVAARDFFIAAMEQNAYQANAYYGLAISSEKLGDLDGAIGAMRSFLHLADGNTEGKFLRKARAALWEWESQLTPKPAG